VPSGSSATSPAATFGISEERDGAVGHFVFAVERVEEPADVVFDHFGQSADVRRDDRYFTGHRFKCRETKALLRRWQQKDIGNR